MTELFTQTETASDAERPLRADARRNRERILQSAREVFAECGTDAQIDDIAQRAGVGVGTVYRHFPTKEALMAELVRQKFRRFAAGARDALQRDGEPFAVFADLLRRNADELAARRRDAARARRRRRTHLGPSANRDRRTERAHRRPDRPRPARRDDAPRRASRPTSGC